MSRSIRGLKWAQLAGEAPKHPEEGATAPALKLARARGRRYETRVGKALGDLWHRGCWIEFEDQNGRGYCQPDYLRVSGDEVLVLECKLLWTPQGFAQLERLYRPVVESIWEGKRVLGIQVAGGLTTETDRGSVRYDLDSAIARARLGHLDTTLLWLGKVPTMLHTGLLG